MQLDHDTSARKPESRPDPSARLSLDRRGVAPDDSEVRGPAGALLDEVDRCVAASLVAGRLPPRTLHVSNLLGKVMLARSEASRVAPRSAAAARLTIAEQSLRAVLEQCHVRKSHRLEWIIIALIALDIVVALV